VPPGPKVEPKSLAKSVANEFWGGVSLLGNLAQIGGAMLKNSGRHSKQETKNVY
jgi:hypothetical protein